MQDNIKCADRRMMKKYDGLLNINSWYLSNDERVHFMSILPTGIRLELVLDNTSIY